MTRHRFDPVALVSGLVIGTAGVIVLAGGRLVDEGRLLVPLGLVALGVALLLRSAPGRDRPEEPPGTAHRPTGPSAPGSAVAPGTPAGEPARPTDAPDLREAPSGEPASGPAGRDRATGDTTRPGPEFYLGPGWRPAGTGTDDERPAGPDAAARDERTADTTDEGDPGRAGGDGGDTGHPPDTATGGGDRQPT